MTKITIAKGDGIGPEIMDATLSILRAGGAQIECEEIEIGEKVYLNGNLSGISSESWKSLRQNRIFLKSPITTPLGGGYKSLNVTLRKVLGLFSNVRPCQSFYPFVLTKHPVMDVVIIRENEEDLYAGIEHQQTNEVIQCLKLISKPGTEKIIRYAFEWASTYGRKKVTCFTKDNIMKMTDGIFHKMFEEIGKEYPNIEKEHMIIDIGAAKLAETPENFDVIVTLNLYGDIISDIAAQITGSVGLGSSVNIGQNFAMFEAIHGSAPDIAGKNQANPSGLLLSAIQMLVHIGQSDVAQKINNAWLKTIEDGIHTSDIYKEGTSKKKVGTKEFTEAVIERLGQIPQQFKPVSFLNKDIKFDLPKYEKIQRDLIGVDVFLCWDEEERNPEILGKKLEEIYSGNMKLTLITNRGVKVYPNGFDETFCTDHWRCRFKNEDFKKSTNQDIINLLQKINDNGFEIIKTENLYSSNDKPLFTVGQGQ